MGVCYSYKQKEEIKQKNKIRLKERILREKIQRDLNLKVLKSFWKITKEEPNTLKVKDSSEGTVHSGTSQKANKSRARTTPISQLPRRPMSNQ